MSEASRDAIRILIGAESAADAAGALRLATFLAGRDQAAFGGLLTLPDEDGIARVQSQRIVAVSGQILLSPDVAGQKRLAECEARAFRQQLARSARSVGAHWSADVRHGALETQVATEAGAWDITIIGHRLLHRRKGTVLVLSSAATREAGASRVAELVAQRLGTGVEELILPGSRGASRLDVFNRINRMNTAAIVFDAASARIGGLAKVSELLTVARCPVIILQSPGLLPRLQHLVHIPPANSNE